MIFLNQISFGDFFAIHDSPIIFTKKTGETGVTEVHITIKRADDHLGRLTQIGMMV